MLGTWCLASSSPRLPSRPDTGRSVAPGARRRPGMLDGRGRSIQSATRRSRCLSRSRRLSAHRAIRRKPTGRRCEAWNGRPSAPASAVQQVDFPPHGVDVDRKARATLHAGIARITNPARSRRVRRSPANRVVRHIRIRETANGKNRARARARARGRGLGVGQERDQARGNTGRSAPSSLVPLPGGLDARVVAGEPGDAQQARRRGVEAEADARWQLAVFPGGRPDARTRAAASLSGRQRRVRSAPGAAGGSAARSGIRGAGRMGTGDGPLRFRPDAPTC
jgi:hypothetical protein